MANYRVVLYINNFFAGVGGEEMAHIGVERRPGAHGPGIGLQKELGEDFEIISTLVCGDNYFGEHTAAATQELMAHIRADQPQLFIAGPAFNAGRYGFACGSIAKAVQDELGIPAVTAMYPENPGADAFRKFLYIVETKNSAADMRNALPKLAALGKKLAKGELVGKPAEEGYLERGIRVNYFHEQRGSERAVEMLVQKMRGENPPSEYPLPVIDRVEPAAPVPDISKIKVAVVTSGGIVPTGNPDRIESSSATKYGKYSIAGMDHMDKADFLSIHGGYDRTFILEDPDLVVPLDVLRELEAEGVIGELADYFITTTGTGTSTGNAKKFGEDFAPKLKADGVGAVILTST